MNTGNHYRYRIQQRRIQRERERLYRAAMREVIPMMIFGVTLWLITVITLSF
jgi:hypothetical protein